ncbi:MAG TPA: alpha/beta fold hydrolase [Steroidobacteraceae bacterium]|jgi:pimeloyl-ACP methyl ester carboxylesterase|nr:alpha/beta fold hydrolase [Steroidobacteraceae bacterium]
MIEERRKPVLGRVVPGVSPAMQRRLRGFFRVAQALSSSLAGWLAFLMFLKPPRRKLDPADAPILQRARRSTLRCGKDRFTIFRWEHPGPPVVLLHGWGSHAARFADFVAPLHAAGFSAIGIDAPAHGTSPGRFSDLPRFRDSLAEVLRAHEPIYAVIGHSLGGGAVLTVLAETADHHPKKICLFGVPSDMDYILGSFAMMLGLQAPAQSNLRARFRKRFGRPATAVSAAAAAPSVRIPVLVVHDEEDNVAPIVQGAALAQSIPGAILWRTRGFGHSGALRDPATIQRVIEFLKS